MIVQAIRAVEAHLGKERTRRCSLASVCTTRPKYLVFGPDAEYPELVVEFGPVERLTRVRMVLQALAPILPDIVPASLHLGPWDANRHVHIQQGMPGTPWFRISDGLRTPGDWTHLLQRACTTLQAMHDATRQIQAWRGCVSLFEGLETQWARVPDAPSALTVLMNRWRDALGVVTFDGHSEHGDFSVNNMLVSERQIVVIDFDDFGQTMMPLHDVFGLALSVKLSQEMCRLSLSAVVTMCLENAVTRPSLRPEWIIPLFVHHLLWRINECQNLERRAPLRRQLMTILVDVVDDPELVLGDAGRIVL